MKVTLQLLLDEGSKQLEMAGIKEALTDAKYLLFEAFHTDMTHFLLDRNLKLMDDAMTEKNVADYHHKIEMRTERIPLQQITGNREFMGLEFAVNEHVLIPRQDTEDLVEQVIKDYKGKNPKILDLCTGSGCIAVSLSVIGKYSEIIATDISEEALKVAKKNAGRLIEEQENLIKMTSELQSEEPWRLELCACKPEGNQKITLMKSDLFSSFEGKWKQKFDVIVSNPPYIPTEVIEGLEPEVRDHEPHLALDGMEDGLYFYRRLAAECREYLNPGGAVYFEIGFDQGHAVSTLLRNAGFKQIRVIKDTPGLDRIVNAVIV